MLDDPPRRIAGRAGAAEVAYPAERISIRP
jgi:hypothetical protein